MKNGFSLVELSIVLVILGLLVGGILAGQSLIHASEIRKTVSDMQKIKTSLAAFRDKYMGFPGDIANATSFWGDQATGPSACGDPLIPNGTPGTCNGNSDGLIAYSENYRGWQQLYMGGLWEAQLTGVGQVTSPFMVIGLNTPRSGLSDAIGYQFNSGMSSYAYTTMKPQNIIVIDTINAAGNQLSGIGVPTIDAWNMDTKMDDGMPGYGSNRIYATGGGALSASAYNFATGTMCEPVIGMGL